DIVEKIREARDTKPAETGSEGRALIRDGRYPLDRLIDRISERLGDPWAPPRIPAEGFEILLRGQTVEEDIHIRWALRSGLLLQLRPRNKPRLSLLDLLVAAFQFGFQLIRLGEVGGRGKALQQALDEEEPFGLG